MLMSIFDELNAVAKSIWQLFDIFSVDCLVSERHFSHCLYRNEISTQNLKLFYRINSAPAKTIKRERERQKWVDVDAHFAIAKIVHRICQACISSIFRIKIQNVVRNGHWMPDELISWVCHRVNCETKPFAVIILWKNVLWIICKRVWIEMLCQRCLKVRPDK